MNEAERGETVRAIFIAGLGAALAANLAQAQQPQVVGQPVLRAQEPAAAKATKRLSSTAKPAQGATKSPHPDLR